MKSLVMGIGLSLLMSGAALANCYEGIGCDDSEFMEESAVSELGCEQLWDVRNMIFKQNGYCFKTGFAIDRLGNDGCFIEDADAVRMNNYERANISLIQTVEAAKSCGP